MGDGLCEPVPSGGPPWILAQDPARPAPRHPRIADPPAWRRAVERDDPCSRRIAQAALGWHRYRRPQHRWDHRRSDDDPRLRGSYRPRRALLRRGLRSNNSERHAGHWRRYCDSRRESSPRASAASQRAGKDRHGAPAGKPSALTTASSLAFMKDRHDGLGSACVVSGSAGPSGRRSGRGTATRSATQTCSPSGPTGLSLRSSKGRYRHNSSRRGCVPARM